MKQVANDRTNISSSPHMLNLTLGLPRFLFDILLILLFLAIFSPDSRWSLPNYGVRHTDICRSGIQIYYTSFSVDLQEFSYIFQQIAFFTDIHCQIEQSALLLFGINAEIY